MAHWGVGACLADDMGLGKTLQALAVLLERAARGPALVVAPTSVCFNWVRETGRFCPGLRPVLFREGDRAATLSALGPGDLLVCSYGLLVRHAEELKGRRFATLVLDEAQAVKNPATRRARAARDLDAEWKLALTGTPVENHLGELWSLFRILTPGLLGSWEQFRERFANPIERTRDAGRRAALARVVRPFVLRRLKSEVARDLPARTELRREVRLSTAERRLYDEARLAALAAIGGAGASAEGGDRRFVVLAALTRLRQLACHPRLLDPESKLPSAKLSELLELVGELRENGHRALVFSQFTSHLALVREALEARGISYLYLDGQTPEAERVRRVDRFQRGEKELFLISLKAGGTGLNLTAADYVIHLDPWWNPAVEDQATDRAHRIGQSRPVTVYRLVSKGTIEESILALHGEKRDLVAGVLDGAAGTAGLSTEELLELLRGDADQADAEDEEPGDEPDGPQDSASGAGAAKPPERSRGSTAPEAAAPEAAPTGTGAQSAESLAAFAMRFEASLLGQVKPSTAKVYLSAAAQLFRWMEDQCGRLGEDIDAREIVGQLQRYENSVDSQLSPVTRTVMKRMRRFAAN
jgi:SNF2 family DNA or RNA helicase